MPEPQPRPDWDRLYEIAGAQEGLFTTQQAAGAGYSPQLLVHHLSSGRALRVRRGIYRLVHFPAGEHEALVSAWLWSEQAGVFSHQTALALHRLSDAMPSQLHLTVPSAWRRRRLRLTQGLVVYYADLSKPERTWFGPVPVTSVQRTLNDCAREGLSPELLRQAARHALQRPLLIDPLCVVRMIRFEVPVRRRERPDRDPHWGSRREGASRHVVIEGGERSRRP